LLQTAKTVGVTEVKDEDFYKGVAQNAVQLESALSNRKRKANEMEEGTFVGKVFEIITDAKEWYFMECSLDEQDRLRFKLSKPVVVVYGTESMEGNVERVLGHIACCMVIGGGAEPDSNFRSEEKIVRSLSNLVGNLRTETVMYHGLRPELLYLFFACINKKFYLCKKTVPSGTISRNNLYIFTNFEY
jgi:hypothetical protein